CRGEDGADLAVDLPDPAHRLPHDGPRLGDGGQGSDRGGGMMTEALRVILEIGPKGKKVVATAWDWPGLERSGATEEDALAKLEAYLPRYASVTKRARLAGEFQR